MIDSIRHLRFAFVVLAVALFGAPLSPATAAEDGDSAMILVAKPEVRDPFYASSVLIVRPLEGGGHAGFVLNKPTGVSLGEAFPDDGPSQKVREPVFLGGPVNPNVIFALVKGDQRPADGAVQFAKGLYLALSSESVDHVIRQDADHARFFAGAVLWRPGELDEELKLGAWYVMDADSEIALARDPDHLWDTLVQRSLRKL